MSDLSEQHKREDLYATLDSHGWELFLRYQIEEIRALSKALLENENLDDAQRKGYVLARRHLLAGITRVYEKARREMPPWLQQEIG